MAPTIQEGKDQLEEALLGNRGLQAIVEVASRLLGNPCYVGDSRFKVLAVTTVDPSVDPVWAEVQAHGYATLDHMHELEGQGVDQLVRVGMGAQRVTFPSSRHPWLNIAVGDDLQHLAYFGMLEANGPLPDELTPLFTYAARVIACELRNARYEHDSLRSAREHFLFDAVTGAISSPEQFHDLMTRARIKQEGPYLLLVVRDRRERPSIADAVRYQLENISHAEVSARFQSDVVLLLSGRRARAFEGNRRARFEQALTDSGLACGMCTSFLSIHDTARNCREAKVTADLCEGLDIQVPLLAYDDPRVYPFSAVLAGHFSMASFIHPHLQCLEDYDMRKGTELVATLEAYMRNNYNIASTAREFFTHRNTIDYRLKRIEELIGEPLTDPNVNMALWLSLQARKLQRAGVRTN